MATVMRRTVMGLVLCGLMSGCAAVTWTKQEAHRSMLVPENTTTAYVRSAKAMHTLGWQLVGWEAKHVQAPGFGIPQGWNVLAARVNKAVTIQVLFVQADEGTKLDVFVVAEAGYFLDRAVQQEAQTFLDAYMGTHKERAL